MNITIQHSFDENGQLRELITLKDMIDAFNTNNWKYYKEITTPIQTPHEHQSIRRTLPPITYLMPI